VRARRLLAAVLLAAAGTGCAAPETYDYGPWLDHMPRTVLVLPPINASPETSASYAYLSTVTRPIVDWGYYVFPVAMVDAYMRENGMPTPWEMHQVPPRKLGEIFGADAVLRIKVREWGKSYYVFNCHVGIAAEVELVDCATGTLLWKAVSEGSEDTFGAQNDYSLGIIPALIGQLGTTTDGWSMEVAARANRTMRPPPVPGPRSPGFQESVRALRRKTEEGVPPRSKPESEGVE
jgi:hypothetical protein